MSKSPAIGAAWRAERNRFIEAGLETPALDARLLAEKAFGLSGVKLAIAENDLAPVPALAALSAFADRRLAGEPVARILGEKEFYGLNFGLNADTLVPRPETEMLVDLALAEIGDRSARVLDLGTGSGCIVISVLANASGASGVAVDLSADALGQTRLNAEQHGVASRLQLLDGSWFEPLSPEKQFDVILSNPPYIVHDVIAGLAPEVRDHDPALALDGGVDGLAPYRVIAQHVQCFMMSGGLLAVEIGADQGETVPALFNAAGLEQCRLHHDLSGYPRVVTARVR